jgi:hypothetical protein
MTVVVLRDFLSGLLLKPWKGSGATEGLSSREGAHSLGWYKVLRACGE